MEAEEAAAREAAEEAERKEAEREAEIEAAEEARAFAAVVLASSEPFDAKFVFADFGSQPEGSDPNSPPWPFLPPIGLGSQPAGGSPYSQAPSPPTVAPPPYCAPPNPEPAEKRGRGRPLGSKDKVKRRPPSIPFGGVVGRKDKTQRVRLYWKAPPKS
jgi:hypothetical protein